MRKKYIITLSRQFGSGGSEIGKELAKALNLRYVDKSIITEAAQRSGISQSVFERADEQRPNAFINSLVESNYKGKASPLKLDDIVSEDRLFEYTSNVIKEFAKEGDCLIVGRCADDILSDFNTFKVFLFADMNDRVRRISRLYEINEKASVMLIHKTDKKRAGYYNYYTGKTWGAAENYDISLNTSILRRDGTVALLKQFIEMYDNAE